MDMHRDFAKWYKTIQAEESTEALVKRWQGVVANCQSVDQSLLETLTDLVTGRRISPDNEAHLAFCQAFKDADPFFVPDDCAQEIATLASIVLTILLDGSCEEEYSVDTALLLTSALHADGIPINSVTDIGTRALNALDRLAVEQRDRVARFELKQPRVPKINVQKLLAKAPEINGGDPSQTANVLQRIIDQVTSQALTQARLSYENSVRLADHILVKDEELDMLWWAYNDYSTKLREPISKIAPGLRALVAGKELADRTSILPGPLVAKRLLHKIGVKSKSKITIIKLVESCDRDWIEAVLSSRVSRHTPIHHALKLGFDTDDKTAWEPMWRSQTGVQAEFTLTEPMYAWLFYVERQLLARQELAHASR